MWQDSKKLIPGGRGRSKPNATPTAERTQRTMKSLVTAITLFIALLLAAPAAHAWVIHNHTDYELGLKKRWSFGFDKYKVPPKGTLNGEANEPLVNVNITYVAQGDYFQSYSVSIPAQGFAAVYVKKVEIYSADHKLIKTVNMGSYNWR